MSSFIHPQVVPNLYEFCFFCWRQKNIFWRMLVNKQLMVAIDFHCMEQKMLWKSMATVNCLVTNRRYRFRTTWGWVNYDRIFIFGWTIYLFLKGSLKFTQEWQLCYVFLSSLENKMRNSVGCISHSFPLIYKEWGLELLSCLKGLKSTIKTS